MKISPLLHVFRRNDPKLGEIFLLRSGVDENGFKAFEVKTEEVEVTVGTHDPTQNEITEIETRECGVDIALSRETATKLAVQLLNMVGATK